MISWKTYGIAATMLLGTILSSSFASASPVIYNINRTIGLGSVTGFIETDGLMGVLSAADFVDWNLVLFDGTSTFDLFGPLSGNNSMIFVQGADTEAFNSYLMFNFSGIDNGIFLFQQGLFSGNHYYCDSSQPGPCFAGETVVPINVAVGYQNNPNLHGVTVIGIEAGATPEPGTCILLLSGIGIVMRNRRLRSFVTDRP
jgi:hypothetical protein